MRTHPTPSMAAALAALALQTAPALATPPVSRPPEVVDIGAGKFSSMLLLDDGTVWSCGGDGGDVETGQLGLCKDHLESQPLAQQVDLPTVAIGICAGRYSSYAIGSGAFVYSWGRDDTGQLGLGTADPYPHQCPDQSPEATDASQIAAGYRHAISRHTSGLVLTWGSNDVGQLGRSTPSGYSATPTRLPAPTGVTSVAAGPGLSLAVDGEGSAWAWGHNETCQAGQPGRLTVTAPARIPGLDSATQVAAGQYHGLALLENGTVMSWGGNGHGELGTPQIPQGEGAFTCDPVRVRGLPAESPVVQVVAGHWFSAALTADGRVYVWGDNSYGQVGVNPDDANVVYEPHQIPLRAPARRIAAGRHHMLAVTEAPTGRESQVYAWGHNDFGELCNGFAGSTASSYKPTRVIPTWLDALH